MKMVNKKQQVKKVTKTSLEDLRVQMFGCVRAISFSVVKDMKIVPMNTKRLLE